MDQKLRFAFTCSFVVILLVACGTSPTPILPTEAPPSATDTAVVENNTAAPTETIAPTATEPPAALIDLVACDIYTPEDAEAIMGEPVSTGSSAPNEGSEDLFIDSCVYTTEDFHSTSINVFIPTSGGVEDAKALFEDGKSKEEQTWGTAPVDVPGLGDMAYWVGDPVMKLDVLKGQYHFTLTAWTQFGDTPPQPMLDLAQTILDRLP